MSRPPRLLLPHTVVLLTSRVQQGLPFTCTPLMEKILWSALAVACNLYPVKIISFVVMGNHIHIIALVEDPANTEGFMERFKCETAHAVNRLLGRRQVSVWCEGYDSPAILTIEDLIEKMAYVYANPVRAHRTDSIDNYQGLSSWEMFTSGNLTKDVKRVRRPSLERLPKGRLTQGQQQYIAHLVQQKCAETLSFTLYPDAWMKAFRNQKSSRDFHQKVVNRIREIENEFAALRKQQKLRLPTAQEVVSQPMDIPYSPNSFGRRMWCICHDISVRASFISFIKTLRSKAKDIRNRWRQGDWSETFPPGLFPPCPPPIANLLPAFVHRVALGA